MTRIIRIIKESFRMVSNNRLRGFIVILGIAIGVTSLTMTVCVSVGVYEKVMDTVNKQGPDLIQIRPGSDKFNSPASGSREAVSLTEEDSEAIRQHVGNIDSISPVKDKKEIQVKYEDKNLQALSILISIFHNLHTLRPESLSSLRDHLCQL